MNYWPHQHQNSPLILSCACSVLLQVGNILRAVALRAVQGDIQMSLVWQADRFVHAAIEHAAG